MNWTEVEGVHSGCILMTCVVVMTRRGSAGAGG